MKTSLIYPFLSQDIRKLPKNIIVQGYIGFSGNNDKDFAARINEHLRHFPDGVVYNTFPFDPNEMEERTGRRGDAAIHDMLADRFNGKYIRYIGKGHDRIDATVEQWFIFLEAIQRFMNKVNIGSSKLHTFSASFEQTGAVAAAFNFFQQPSNAGRRFLWDCVMRFGKTHAAYRLANKLGAKRVLILTRRPSDVKRQWRDELDHIAFAHFEFLTCKEFVLAAPDTEQPIVVFSSIQEIEKPSAKREKLFAEHWDFVIYDECHFGLGTDLAREITDALQKKNELCLSGTPFKMLLEGEFDRDAIYSWTYFDEQASRKQEIQKLGWAAAQASGYYFPRVPIRIFLTELSDEVFSDAAQFTEDEGFTFAKLFAVDNGEFKYPTAVDNFIETLVRCGMPYSKQAHTAYRFNPNNLKHAFWLLPNIAACELFAARLRKHRVFKYFEIIVAAGKNEKKDKKTLRLVSGKIGNVENGLLNGKIGTITLSCGKLTHGVSIPEWGSILILSDIGSAQLWYQAIFRTKTINHGKKFESYVFDFSPNRVINNLVHLAIKNNPNADLPTSIREVLNVFDVLSYSDNKFVLTDVDKLMSAFLTDFSPRSSARAFAEIVFEIDGDVEAAMSRYAETMIPKDTGEIVITSNDIDVGKNYETTKIAAMSSTEEEEPSEAEIKEQIKKALEKLPTLISITNGNTVADFITNTNPEECQSITGLPFAWLARTLASQNPANTRRLEIEIVKIRRMETA